MPEPTLLNPAEVGRFCEWIHDRSGLDFPPSRLADVEQVLADTLGSRELPNVDALLALLEHGEQSEQILKELLADLTVSETYFFRNQPQFHALEHHVLPELIARRQFSRQLRIWSAGCATGEEPYSLAILLERLLPDLADWNIHLLATDINADALAHAERGRYNEWSFRHVATEIKEQYFLPRGPELEIHPRLRDRVTFARLNLAEDAFPSYFTQTNNLDLILCRNVLIYFRGETVRRIVERFYDAVVDEGWLIVGHAEPSQVTFGKFVARNFPGTVVYQKVLQNPFPLRQEPGWASRLRLRDQPVLGRESSARGSAFKLRPAPSGEMGKPSEPSPFQKAKVLADQMQWVEAEKWIAVALEEEPLSAPAHYLRGLILLERSQPEAALAALRNCVFADAEFVMGHVALADLLVKQGQPERARKALESAGRLAAARPTNEAIPEGDGVTAGGLLEMINLRKSQL